MIKTVDKNGDGKVNYSEFRVMMGAHPLIIPSNSQQKLMEDLNENEIVTLTTASSPNYWSHHHHSEDHY